MCYHKTYLFLTCGHVALSETPILDSQCPYRDDARATTTTGQEEHSPTKTNDDGMKHTALVSRPQHASPPSPPSTPPPLDRTTTTPTHCAHQLTHPLHTLNIPTLCPPCQEERDERIQAFELSLQTDYVNRISLRSGERNARSSDTGGKRLFRSSTALAMIMEPQTPAPTPVVTPKKGVDAASKPETPTKSPVAERAVSLMEGFRGFVGLNVSEGDGSPTKSEGTPTKSLSILRDRSPAKRLSFNAFDDD